MIVTLKTYMRVQRSWELDERHNYLVSNILDNRSNDGQMEIRAVQHIRAREILKCVEK